MQTLWWYWVVSLVLVVGTGWVLIFALARVRRVFDSHMEVLRRVENTAHLMTARATTGDLANVGMAGVLPREYDPSVILILPVSHAAPPRGEDELVRILVEHPSPLDNVILLDSRRTAA